MQNIKSLLTEFDKSLNITHIAASARELAEQLGSISYESVTSFAESHFIQIRFLPGLPKAAFGYSDVKDGIRYIFVNRNTSECQMTYTIVHEIGHHLLNHYPINRHCDLQDGLLDLEANLFVFFVYSLALSDIKLDELIRENKEYFLCGFSLTLSVLIILLGGGVLAVNDWLDKKLQTQKRLN